MTRQREIVRLLLLKLGKGDVVLNDGSTMLVLEARRDEVDVLWLETGRRATVWLQDVVYGPVEVIRADA